GGDREAHAERLHDHCDHVGEQDHRQERVAVARAAAQVGRPVAGIDIADGDQHARPGGADQPAPGEEPRPRGKRGRKRCEGGRGGGVHGDAPFTMAAYWGITPGPFLGHWAMTAGSTFSVWATISGGVCASHWDSDTVWYCDERKTARNSRSLSPVLR